MGDSVELRTLFDKEERYPDHGGYEPVSLGMGSKYLQSLYWAVMMTTGMGIEKEALQPATPAEAGYEMCVVIIGVVMYAMLLGSAASVAQRRQHGRGPRLGASLHGDATEMPPPRLAASLPVLHLSLRLIRMQAVSQLDYHATTRRQKLDSVKQYIRYKKVPKFLRLRIEQYYECAPPAACAHVAGPVHRSACVGRPKAGVATPSVARLPVTSAWSAGTF